MRFLRICFFCEPRTYCVNGNQRPALAAAAPTQREAEAVLARIRRSMPTIANGIGYKLIGVQVRLGDKAREGYFQSVYAPISWEYYRTAMRELSRKFMGAGASGVAFVVTAGGSMGASRDSAGMQPDQLT